MISISQEKIKGSDDYLGLNSKKGIVEGKFNTMLAGQITINDEVKYGYLHADNVLSSDGNGHFAKDVKGSPLTTSSRSTAVFHKGDTLATMVGEHQFMGLDSMPIYDPNLGRDRDVNMLSGSQDRASGTDEYLNTYSTMLAGEIKVKNGESISNDKNGTNAVVKNGKSVTERTLAQFSDNQVLAGMVGQHQVTALDTIYIFDSFLGKDREVNVLSITEDKNGNGDYNGKFTTMLAGSITVNNDINKGDVKKDNTSLKDGSGKTASFSSLAQLNAGDQLAAMIGDHQSSVLDSISVYDSKLGRDRDVTMLSISQENDSNGHYKLNDF